MTTVAFALGHQESKVVPSALSWEGFDQPLALYHVHTLTENLTVTGIDLTLPGSCEGPASAGNPGLRLAIAKRSSCASVGLGGHWVGEEVDTSKRQLQFTKGVSKSFVPGQINELAERGMLERLIDLVGEAKGKI